MKLNHTEAQCRADAAREAEAGDPDQSVGLPAPQLTTKQLCSIGFAVLRAHNDDRLWRALTHDSGPYDLTTPNLALRDLGRAFYAAGHAEAPNTTMKVEVSSDPALLGRAMAAEVEAAMLRAAINQKHAEYEDLKTCAANNARNLLREADDLRDLLHRMIEAPTTQIGAGWKDAMRQALAASKATG